MADNRTFPLPKPGYKHYEDTSFVTGDSPVELDILTDLGRNGGTGSLKNDGVGNFTFAISSDGVNYGDEITVKYTEIYDLSHFDISKLRITWVADSAYRIFIQ